MPSEVAISEPQGDRLIIDLEPNGPVDIGELGKSFAAIEELFGKFKQQRGDSELVPVRLCVAKVEHGSIRVFLVPLLSMLGGYVEYISAVVTMNDFAQMLIDYLKKFSDDTSGGAPPTTSETESLKQFIRPLTSKTGSGLKIKRARYHSKTENSEISIEYEMQGPEITRAFARMERAIEQAPLLDVPTYQKIYRQVLMRLHQMNTSEGKEKGRTGDRAIISEISPRDLPMYFPKEASQIKEKILTSSENPFAKAYVVDVIVDTDRGDAKIYRIIGLHEIIDLD